MTVRSSTQVGLLRHTNYSITGVNPFVNISKSYLFLAIIAITTIVQILLVQLGGEFASTVPLSFAQWTFCIFVSALALPWGTQFG